MQFQAGKKIKLPCGATAVIIRVDGQLLGGGGGGSSNLIEICGDVVWRSGDGDLSGYVLLPIELISFEASLAKRGVLLNWITASELNNDYFQIQHSINGVDWEVIGTVDGAGNSSIELKYEFVHEEGSLEGNYYRMLQVDFDGGKKLYPPIFINNQGFENAGIFVFPNPSTSYQRTIYFDNKQKDNFVLNLFDLKGQQVYSKTISTTNTGYNVIDFNDIPQAGVYFLEIDGNYSRIVFL